MRAKFTSRKFWVMIAGYVTGLIIYFTGQQDIANQISSVIISAGSLIGYMAAEGYADGKNSNTTTTTTTIVKTDDAATQAVAEENANLEEGSTTTESK